MSAHHRRLTPGWLLIAGLATITFLTACTTTSTPGASTPSGGSLPATITIHALSDLTGANAAVGQSHLNGWKLAVDAVNSSGLLGSSKLQLSNADTQSNATQAASLASQAVQGKYAAVLYGPSSALAVAMAPIFDRAKQVAIFVQAGSSGITIGPSIFRLTPTLNTFYPLSLQYLQKQNAKSIATIFLNDNPTYTQVDQLVKSSASQYGMTYADGVGVATTQTNVSTQVSKLAGYKTDAVAVLMNGAPAASVVGQLRQQGYPGKIIAAPNIGANNVLGAVGAAGNGVVWATDWASTSTVSASKSFVDAYQKAYNKAPDNYAAEAYDSIFFLAQGLKGGATVDQAALTAALAKVGTDGFGGVLGEKLTLKDNSEVSPGTLVQWQNGAIVAVGSS